MIEQSPPVPPEILKDFNVSILEKSTANPSENSIFVQTLKLEPINVFRTEKDEEERMAKLLKAKDEQKYKEKILKEEQDKIQKAIVKIKKRNAIVL